MDMNMMMTTLEDLCQRVSIVVDFIITASVDYSFIYFILQ